MRQPSKNCASSESDSDALWALFIAFSRWFDLLSVTMLHGQKWRWRSLRKNDHLSSNLWGSALKLCSLSVFAVSPRRTVGVWPVSAFSLTPSLDIMAQPAHSGQRMDGSGVISLYTIRFIAPGEPRKILGTAPGGNWLDPRSPTGRRSIVKVVASWITRT